MRLQVINGSVYIAGEIHEPITQSRNRNLKLQILQVANKFRLPDLDLYINSDDFVNLDQTNRSHLCPHQGPLISQVSAAGAVGESRICTPLPYHLVIPPPLNHAL